MSENPDDGDDEAATPEDRSLRPEDEPATDASLDPEEDLPEDPFTEVEVGEVDEEAVWAADQEIPPEEAPEEVIVPKRKYCERCEHFAAPPEPKCTHPGTEILELVDMEHVRLSNCPIVAERRRIGATDIRDPEE